MIFGIAVPTRVFGTAAKEIFVLVIIVGTDVLTIIVGTDVPTIIVLPAYYWKSCGGDTAQHLQEKLSCGWVGGPSQEMIPLRGSILQAETCQILSLAENPRWSRVWQ